VGKAVPGVKVRVVREETNSYGDMVGELLGYGRNLCMGYLNKVSFRFTVSLGSFFYTYSAFSPCTLPREISWFLFDELFVKKNTYLSLQENESRDLLDAESWIQLGDHAHLDNEGFVVLEGLKKVSNYTQNGQSFL
jgi:acyl-CoA synthetase (AMP-forming)/AMP-acid ligase II